MLAVIVCITFFLLSRLLMQAATLLFGLDLSVPWHLRMVMAFNQAVAVLAPSLLLNKMLAGNRKTGFISSLRRRPSARYASMSFLAAVAVLPLMSFLSHANAFAIPGSGWLHELSMSEDALVQSVYSLLFDDAGSWGWVGNFMVLAVIAGICEEFLFRGIVQGFLAKVLARPGIAVVISALIFSLVHLQVSEFLPRFAMGVMLGYAYFLSGNIWVPVVMHVSNNGFALLFSRFGLDDTFLLAGISLPAFILLCLLCKKNISPRHAG